jgi:hypothetical protein
MRAGVNHSTSFVVELNKVRKDLANLHIELPRQAQESTISQILLQLEPIRQMCRVTITVKLSSKVTIDDKASFE